MGSCGRGGRCGVGIDLAAEDCKSRSITLSGAGGDRGCEGKSDVCKRGRGSGVGSCGRGGGYGVDLAAEGSKGAKSKLGIELIP